jgi:hypothetical protein
MADYIAVVAWRLGAKFQVQTFLSVAHCGSKSIIELRKFARESTRRHLLGYTAPPLFEKTNKLVRRLQPGLCAGLTKRTPHEDGKPTIGERMKGVFICEVVT